MSQHSKRLTSPRSWPIKRKTSNWIVSPRAGPHPIEGSIPLLIAVRDILNYCDTASEGKKLIGGRNFIVDGKVATDYRRPLGLMDVLSVQKTKEHFRVLIDSRGKLRFVRADEKASKWKLARIENVTTIKGGKFQVSLHDGRSIIMPEKKYNTGDVLKIELPSQKILEVYPLSAGHTAFLIGGGHIGQLATISKYEVTRNAKANMVHFEEFSTTKNNVFVVGAKTPEVTLPEVSTL